MDQIVDNKKNGSGYYIAHSFAISNSLLVTKNIAIQGSAFLYGINNYLNIVIGVISVMLYLYAFMLKENRKVMFKSQFYVLGFVVLLWMITSIVNSNLFSYSYVRYELSEFIVFSLPALLFLPMLYDCDDLMEALYKCRWFIFVAACITVVLIMLTGTIQDAGSRSAVYSMAFGRAMLLPALLFASHWFNYQKVIDLLCAGFCIFSILVFGSRFPLLCIGSYIIWKIIQSPISMKKLILIGGGIFLSIILLIDYKELVNILLLFFDKAGINSRSLNLLLSGSFNYDSGRGVIISRLINKINEHPILGYGAGGGNVALNNGLSHSFIVDTFANLGYLGGSIFLIITFSMIYNQYRRCNKNSTRDYMMIAICSFAPICLFQTSLWSASNFWILVALCTGRIGHIYRKELIV